MRDSYTNPYETIRIEYFEIFGLTNRIHDTNLLKKGIRNESTIRIFWMPYGFANPKYRIRMDSFKVRLCTKIREDSWGFVGFMKTGRIFWKLAGFICTIRIFPYPDSWTTIRYESGIRIVRYESNLFEVRICTHDTVRIHGFAKRIHVFTNLLYDSRILNWTTIYLIQILVTQMRETQK